MYTFGEVKIEPITQTTLAFLIKDELVLLAMKKRGFGQGKWNGVGGKQDAEESIDQTMIREVFEEIEVTPISFERVAILDFTFLPQPEWNQQVHVYLVTKWDGVPAESEEMAPSWYDKAALPFSEMWSDDPHWLPRVLAGKKIHAQFSFNDESQVVDQRVVELA